jgi:CRISPR-associated protein Csn2
MILSHEDLDEQITFRDGEVNVLVVENRAEMSKLVGELVRQSSGRDGGFSLFDGTEEMEIEKSVKVIMDPFSLPWQLKEADAGAISSLKKSLVGEDHYEELSSILSAVGLFTDRAIKDEDPRLTAGEPPTAALLLKLMDVHLTLSDDSLVEAICDYLSVCRKYTKWRVFVFVNLKCFLSENEIRELYDFAMYEKINILMIEASEKPLMDCESETIIDADLCEIHKKGGKRKIFEV